MVNKNIQMKKRNNDTWENLFPLTLFENVYDNEGVSLPNRFSNLNETIDLMDDTFTNDLENIQTELTNSTNSLENELNTQTNQLSNDIDNGLNSLETSVNNKFTELNPRIDTLEKYEQEMTMDNGIWSWWNYPLAYFKDMKTFFGTTNTDGQIRMNTFDHSTKEFNSTHLLTGEADDHNAPTIEFLTDGRPIVFYTRHNKDNYIRYRIGNVPHDINSLGDEKQLGLSGSVTYTQVYIDEFDHIHLFTRVSDTRWAYLKSENQGESFDNTRNMIDFGTGNQSYLKIKPHQNKRIIRMTFTTHPLADNQDIYYCFFETNTGNLTIPSGQTIGNLFGGSGVELTPDDLLTAYSPPTGYATRLFDVSDGELSFVFAEFTNNVDGVYKYARWSGNGFEITNLVDTGRTIGAGNSRYYGGAIIPINRGNELILSREENGTWFIERWWLHGNVWESEIVDQSNTDKLFRPIVPVENNQGIFWVAGDYDEETFTNFDTDIHFNVNMFDTVNNRMKHSKEIRHLPSGLKIEQQKVTFERGDNPDITFPLDFDYFYRPQISVSANSTALNDIRDSNYVVGGVTSNNDLRLLPVAPNVSWNGTGDLNLIVTITGY